MAGGVVGKVIVNSDAVYRAFDFHTAFEFLNALKASQAVLNIDAGMTCSGDNGEGVHTVVFAHQFPRDVSDCFAVMTYVERAVGMDGTNLPALFGTKFSTGVQQPLSRVSCRLCCWPLQTMRPSDGTVRTK